MTNLIALADAAIFLLPLIGGAAFLAHITVRSVRRFAW